MHHTYTHTHTHTLNFTLPGFKFHSQAMEVLQHLEYEGTHKHKLIIKFISIINYFKITKEDLLYR